MSDKQISANTYLGETYRRKFGSGEDNKPSRQQVVPHDKHEVIETTKEELLRIGREERAAGYAACKRDAVEAVKNIKQIVSWESDGERIVDVYFDADEKTKDASIKAISSLVPND